MERIKEPTKEELNILKQGLINKVLTYGQHNAVYSLNSGNITYTLLYCKEGLKLWGRYFNYSKCLFSLEYNKITPAIKEVLIKR